MHASFVFDERPLFRTSIMACSRCRSFRVSEYSRSKAASRSETGIVCLRLLPPRRCPLPDAKGLGGTGGVFLPEQGACQHDQLAVGICRPSRIAAL